ncbi:MAG: hypothetical protein PHT94_04995 [Candidatus Nanoarchaeia archaeon]|nr:hypothetical protein [Candidatus Nanoarchaeia archaeon]
MEKTITLRFKKTDLDKIKSGADKDQRSISSFLRKSALDKTEELLKEKEE